MQVTTLLGKVDEEAEAPSSAGSQVTPEKVESLKAAAAAQGEKVKSVKAVGSSPPALAAADSM
eukprot:1157636-Pelagomonas_calceolata.AAC.2